MNIAIIQARNGSKRFPKKSINLIGKMPLIEWVISRTKKSKLIDEIVLATTKLKQDEILINFAKKYKIKFYRGKKDDVLSRFVNIVKKKKKNINIIRICADNPFIDPNQLDILIRFFQKSKLDYAFNHINRLQSFYADGFGAEILTKNTLIKIFNNSKSAKEREHVTFHIWKNKKLFLIGYPKVPSYLSYPKLRFDIDTLKDFKYISKLIDNGVNINSSAKKIINIAKKIKNER